MAFNVTYTAVGDGKRDIWGATEMGPTWTLNFSGADTYVTGGLALTSSLFGLSRPIGGIYLCGFNSAAILFDFGWNTQTQKLMMFDIVVTAAGATHYQFNEAAAGTSMANFQITATILCQR